MSNTVTYSNMQYSVDGFIAESAQKFFSDYKDEDFNSSSMDKLAYTSINKAMALYNQLKNVGIQFANINADAIKEEITASDVKVEIADYLKENPQGHTTEELNTIISNYIADNYETNNYSDIVVLVSDYLQQINLSVRMSKLSDTISDLSNKMSYITSYFTTNNVTVNGSTISGNSSSTSGSSSNNNSSSSSNKKSTDTGTTETGDVFKIAYANINTDLRGSYYAYNIVSTVYCTAQNIFKDEMDEYLYINCTTPTSDYMYFDIAYIEDLDNSYYRLTNTAYLTYDQTSYGKILYSSSNSYINLYLSESFENTNIGYTNKDNLFTGSYISRVNVRIPDTFEPATISTARYDQYVNHVTSYCKVNESKYSVDPAQNLSSVDADVLYAYSITVDVDDTIGNSTINNASVSFNVNMTYPIDDKGNTNQLYNEENGEDNARTQQITFEQNNGKQIDEDTYFILDDNTFSPKNYEYVGITPLYILNVRNGQSSNIGNATHNVYYITLFVYLLKGDGVGGDYADNIISAKENNIDIEVKDFKFDFTIYINSLSNSDNLTTDWYNNYGQHYYCSGSAVDSEGNNITLNFLE